MFNSLSKGTKDTLEISRNVLEASNFQKDQITEVFNSVESVVQISKQAAAGTEQLASSAGELSSEMKNFNESSSRLNDMGKDLKKSMSNFKLHSEVASSLLP